MDRNRFVTLSFLAFGLIVCSFLVLGISRLVVPFRTAQLLAAPTALLALGLAAYLLVHSVLAVTGLRELEP